jgi:multiple sugar transport system permease protein
MKREQFQHGLVQAKHNKVCYLFLAPYAILFFTFFILPICTSIFYGFTYYNILEPARFIGLQNYINLILQDEVFLIAIKNTFVIAVITGPVGYILSFLFAWFINELPKWIRSVAVVIFYAPSIASSAFTIFSVLFRGDAYGWFNAILMEFGLIDAPKLWLLDPTYMMTILIIVILWMSMDTGFLSFVAGFQGIDRSMYEAGHVDGVRVYRGRQTRL